MIDGIWKSLAKWNHRHKRNSDTISARWLIFGCLDDGMAWQEAFQYAKELGCNIKKESARRYYYSWKRKNDDMWWQAQKKFWKENPDRLAKFAEQFGVSVRAAKVAMINCRTFNTFLRRLGIPTKRDREMLEKKKERQKDQKMDEIVQKLKECVNPMDAMQFLQREAEGLGINLFDLLDSLGKHVENAKFKAQLLRLLNGR